jgi:hypothetical protein
MDPMTHGKWLYLKHHLVGIRREVGSLIEADEGYAEEREAADELDTMIARVNRVLHECPRYTMPCALEISEE